MESLHPLNSTWILWYHMPSDKNWGKESYIKVYEITTIEDYWRIYNHLSPQHFENGMYFLMRKDIFPLWEDAQNRNGGCWSLKIDKKTIYKSWTELSIALLGETLMQEEKNYIYINGITVSPKKGFCILKIWNSDKNKSDVSLLRHDIPYINLGKSIYKAHK